MRCSHTPTHLAAKDCPKCRKLLFPAGSFRQTPGIPGRLCLWLFMFERRPRTDSNDKAYAFLCTSHGIAGGIARGDISPFSIGNHSKFLSIDKYNIEMIQWETKANCPIIKEWCSCSNLETNWGTKKWQEHRHATPVQSPEKTIHPGFKARGGYYLKDQKKKNFW